MSFFLKPYLKDAETVGNIMQKFSDYQKYKHIHNVITYIPNLMLPYDQKDKYIVDKLVDAVIAPLNIVADGVPETNSLPSAKDIENIATRSQAVIQKLALPHNTGIFQEPNSYGNYPCTAVVNKVLSCDNSNYNLADDGITLRCISTSTYKDLDYKSLLKEVCELFSQIYINTHDRHFNLKIQIASVNEQHNSITLHPFFL